MPMVADWLANARSPLLQIRFNGKSGIYGDFPGFGPLGRIACCGRRVEERGGTGAPVVITGAASGDACIPAISDRRRLA
jgi:hypothetical protein